MKGKKEVKVKVPKPKKWSKERVEGIEKTNAGIWGLRDKKG